jgi:hypothetical protein
MSLGSGAVVGCGGRIGLENVVDGLLSAISTLTTVGCGDRFPTSPLGRRIAVALTLVRVDVSTCSPRRLRRPTLSEGEVPDRVELGSPEVLERLACIERQLDQQPAPD